MKIIKKILWVLLSIGTALTSLFLVFENGREQTYILFGLAPIVIVGFLIYKYSSPEFRKRRIIIFTVSTIIIILILVGVFAYLLSEFAKDVNEHGWWG